jgi:hypothetical protein
MEGQEQENQCAVFIITRLALIDTEKVFSTPFQVSKIHVNFFA